MILLARPAGHVGEPEIEELGLLEAVVALLPESSAVDRLERPLHVVAELVERAGPPLRVSYAEAGELVSLAAELIVEAT